MNERSVETRERAAPARAHDAAVLELIWAYRRDKSWSGLLLELVGDDIEFQIGWLRPRPPVITADDIRSQLLVELLDLAGSLDLALLPDRFAYRLVRRARRRVQKQLKLETRYQSSLDPLDRLDDGDDEEES